MKYKDFKKLKNQLINQKLKQWLDDILPNSQIPELPVNPDETITGGGNELILPHLSNC